MGRPSRGNATSLRRNRDGDRLLLRVARVLLADAELERALDLVRAGLVGRRLHREREALLGELRGVALRLVAAAGLERRLRELHAGGRLERQLDREVGRDVIARGGRDLDRRLRL